MAFEHENPLGSRSTQSGRVEKIRVLHVINGEFYSGAERVQDLLAQDLEPLGFEVGFACLKPVQFPDMRSSRHAPLYDATMWSRFDVRPIREVARIIRRERYRLVHSHTARSALVAAAASKLVGVPMVHHVHSHTADDTTHRWRSRLNAAVERVALRRASALIPVSQSLGEHLRHRGFSEDVISVVHNGVPPREPRVSSREPALPRDRSQRVWTLGIVALFRPRKGVEVLLRCLGILRQQGLPVQLRAVGRFEDAQYERTVKHLCEELAMGDVVCWKGFTRDVDSELAKMDVLVLPSLFGEGLPMVVLEAMAAGVPVVSARVAGIPEAIRDGRDGLIVEPNNHEDLAEAIAKVVRGEVDWHALRNNALERQAERFSDKAMAAGVAAVYRRVVGGS